MNLQELCKELQLSENTLKRSFNRTVDSLKRNKGIILTKTGYGDSANYTITYDETVKEIKPIQLSDRLVGKEFGHLTVLRDTGKREHRSIIWDCICKCGTHKEVTSNHLNSGHVKTCAREDCPYHHFYDDITNQCFGKLTAKYPTTMKDGSHMYWMCECECGNMKEVASNHLKRGNVQSCGCITTSIGELNIRKILQENNIEYQEQISFDDLRNIKPLRYDFGIYKDGQLTRLIEFDGIQHFEEQTYFTHSLTETKENDIIKNKYSKDNNIPLVRIPYWERDKITLEMLLGEEYLIE